MKRDFDSVLDDCLSHLGTGGDVDACLARYPEYATELRPLLLLATDLSTLDTPLPVERARLDARQRMLRSVRQQRKQSVVSSFFSRVFRFAPSTTGTVRFSRRFATLVPLVLLVMLTSAVTVGAARSSLPGDALYPVKLTAQRARMVFTLEKSNRDALIQQIDEERRQDIQSALQGDREAKVEFEGTLQQISKGEWIVGGLRLSLNAETVIQGKPVIGAQVSVRGRLPGDGTLLAVSLQVSEIDDLFPSPLPTPSSSATPDPVETEEDVDEDDHTPESVETDELEDDDFDETPEAIETEDSDDGDIATPDLTETDEPEDEDDGTDEPDADDDNAATSEPSSDPDEEDESTPTPSATDDDSEDDVTATPVPDGTEEPDDDDDDETPEPDGTVEPDDDDDEPESTKEPKD